MVKFDVIPKYYFSLLPDDFYSLAFLKSENLQNPVPLEEISPYLKLDESKLLAEINKDCKTSFTKIAEIKHLVDDKRLARFNQLIDSQFTDSKIIEILELFKKRNRPSNDKEIQKLVTDGADAPIIFEYILAIAWYKISERKGNILHFMNLSLEADLLPKTHAGGGKADIIWKYEKTSDYPKHDLLIEATLSDSKNQRRMEMEPVSRHLGDYILEHSGHQTYCAFVSNYLHLQLISDFRSRKSGFYYNSDGSKSVNGMMIIPLKTDLFISLLKTKTRYSELYKIFNYEFNSSLPPKEWYAELKNKIEESTSIMK